jgi:DNA polymerase sigma
MSLTNGLAKHNSRLIQYYCQLEPRFRQLALVLRFWAKINDIVGGSQRMTSYAFTQLVIYFCQKRQLLPSLDAIRELSPVDPLIVK